MRHGVPAARVFRTHKKAPLNLMMPIEIATGRAIPAHILVAT
jgi:hypothetical protein